MKAILITDMPEECIVEEKDEIVHQRGVKSRKKFLNYLKYFVL